MSAKTFKKSDASFNNAEKLQKSFAQIFVEEREKERQAVKNAMPVARESVMIGKRASNLSPEDAEREAAIAAEKKEEAEATEYDIFEENEDLDNDPELAAIKARRIAELQRAYEAAQENLKRGHGDYSEITQDEFLSTTTKSKYVVCHFFHREFMRCKIVDKHLGIMCKKHVDTKFVKCDVEKFPFFIGKLQVKVLPCVIMFYDGVAVDRIVGFEDFDHKDDFSTKVFEKRVWLSGVIEDGAGNRRNPKLAPVKTLVDGEDLS